MLLQPIKRSQELFFLSDADKYIFILCKMDGHSRSITLGVTDHLFDCRKCASIWYNNISMLIEESPNPFANQAISILEKMYQLMTEDD